MVAHACETAAFSLRSHVIEILILDHHDRPGQQFDQAYDSDRGANQHSKISTVRGRLLLSSRDTIALPTLKCGKRTAGSRKKSRQKRPYSMRIQAFLIVASAHQAHSPAGDIGEEFP